MKAIWNGKVVAEADKDDLIYIERHWYFPPHSVNQQQFLRKSTTPYNCYWKGACQYFDVGAGDNWSHDNAWSYPVLQPSAIDRIKQDFSNYVAFWRDVRVME